MEKLTAAELQVVERTGAGASIPEVAEALHISERTARKHVRNIVVKLSVLVEEEAE